MKKRYQEIKDAQIHSVKYVNDPAAAKQYHDLFLEVIQRIVDEEISKKSEDLSPCSTRSSDKLSDVQRL